MKALSIAVLLASVALTGCASITGTTGQSVSVQTMERGGKEMAGATCELTNNKGKWFVTSPGSVGITRSNDDLQVLCNKDGVEPGRAAVVSATKGSMFGNIIFGGGIGAIVDHNSGAAYEYPAFFQVMMGTFTKIEPPKPATTPNPDDPTSVPAVAAETSVKPLVPQSLQGTKDEKLKELKRLSDAGLITSEVYAEQQRRVMSAQ